MCLTEEQVRAIVRDELRQLLLSMQERADRLDVPYETGEFESRTYQAVSEVARETGWLYHPNEECPRRRYYSQDACICNASDY